VLADEKSLRIVDGQEVLACHVRSYDREQQIEQPSHIQNLVERKSHASAQRGPGTRGTASQRGTSGAGDAA